MPITTSQAELILNNLKPYIGHAATDKHPAGEICADFGEIHPDRLIELGIEIKQVEKEHGAGFYCGMDNNAAGEHVAVFMKSGLKRFINTPQPSARAVELVGKLRNWQR